eukprot:12251-Hanusia_phi.AAC.2
MSIHGSQSGAISLQNAPTLAGGCFCHFFWNSPALDWSPHWNGMLTCACCERHRTHFLDSFLSTYSLCRFGPFLPISALVDL